MFQYSKSLVTLSCPPYAPAKVIPYEVFALVVTLTFAPWMSAQLATSLLLVKVDTMKLKIEELLPYG
jgi:hypothetical protein